MTPNRILGLLDPLQGPDGPYNLRKDTSHLLLLEFFRRRHEVFVASPSGLETASSKVFLQCRKAQVLEKEPYFHFDGEEVRAAADFDLILMRKDPPVDAAYLQALQVLAMIPPPTWVCNAPDALALWNEKLVILQFPRWIPPTRVTAEPSSIERLARDCGGKIILKSLSGFGGRGVYVASLDSPDFLRDVDRATEGGRIPAMVQAFLPEITQGEKRIFLLDGRPLGALRKKPAPGGFLANPDLGAVLSRTRLTKNEERLCSDLGAFLRKNKVFFAGVDVIGERLTEINVTSPGMLWEWNEIDRARHEREIVDLFEKRMKKR